MKVRLTIFFFAISWICNVYCQDSAYIDKPKSGWNFGALPAVTYNTDIGFQYGALTNIYNYGDGTKYPNYLYSIYLEWSRTTKGDGTNKMFFDSKYLLPKGIRITGEISYLTNKMLNFFGFNGYDANYNPNYEDMSKPEYISRAYYKLDRRVFRTLVDFKGFSGVENLKWIAGLGIYNFKIATVDIGNINKDLKGSDKLPDVPLLYDKYVENSVIPASQKNGGITNYIKTGLIYDTRNIEPNPMHGLWTEITIISAPGFIDNKFRFYQLGIIHRQYFTIIKPVLSFTYRVAYQTKLFGDKPFYFLPYLISSYKTEDALGGVKTLRGILNERIQGDGFAFGNFELRYKILMTSLFKQNFYIALNAFTDWGIVTRKYKINYSISDSALGINPNKESMHLCSGGGVRFAMNQNFIISVDYGRAYNTNDGTYGFYVDLDYLY